MCIFHKWGKWGEVKKETWIHVNYSHEQIKTLRAFQERYCQKCGKVQKHYIS